MQPELGSRQTVQVRDVVQAALLLDERARHVLAPFVGQACSASGVAEHLGMPLTSLLYQVRRLLDAKLLVVEREERRAGRAVKYYRAAAERFIVPYALTPAETPDVLLLAQHAGPDARLRRNLVHAGLELLEQQGTEGVGVQVVLDGPRLVLRNMVGPDAGWNFLDPAAPAMVDYWLEDVHLDFEEAKALQAELCELVERYRTKRGGQAYVLRLALAPQRPEN